MESDPDLDPSKIKSGTTIGITEPKSQVGKLSNFVNTVKSKFNIKPKNNISNINSGLDRVAKMIETQCSKYLNVIKHERRFLYRGVTSKESQDHEFFMGNSHSSRIPMDSDPEAQKVWNTIVTQLGIKANRGNSIFTTSNKWQAGSYGISYLIFPLNTASFSWSRSQSDLVINNSKLSEIYDLKLTSNQMDRLAQYYLTLDRYYHSHDMENIKSKAKEDNINSAKEKHIVSKYKNMLMYFDSFRLTLNEQVFYYVRDMANEIIRVSGTTYSLRIIKEFKELLDQIDDQKSIDIEKFEKIYQVTDKDFDRALDSQNEICISGHYIAAKASEDNVSYFKFRWLRENS